MRRFLPALAILAIGTTLATAQNALKNPGFEEPTVTSGSAIGKWFRFGSNNGFATESASAPHSGAQHIVLEISGRNQFAGVFQRLENPALPGSALPVTPGTTVRFTGWHDNIGTGHQTSEIKLEWQGAPTNRLDILLLNEGPYVPFTHTGVAPPGTTGLQVQYAITTFEPGQGGFPIVYIDDFQVTIARVQGDYNNNDTADAADYVVWRKNVGTTTPLPNDLNGGTIGTAQYNEWRAFFGKTFGGSASTITIPEPTSTTLILLAAFGHFAMRIGRR